MRRKVNYKRPFNPDSIHQSVKVTKLVNYIMRNGNKSAARKIVYAALTEAAKKLKMENQAEVLEAAIRNISPNVEVRSRRVGGANYQVPVEVRPERRLALALRWIVAAAKGKKGKPMHVKLADELAAANKNEGEAFKKRETMHRMAEANKAFAHFAW
jgi:small subunit ribosomal protein S7